VGGVGGFGVGEGGAVTAIVVGSIKGAGGVSSTAMGLAAAAGDGAVLMEADPSGGSLLGWSEHLDAGRPSLYDAVSIKDLNTGVQRLGDMRVIVTQGDPWRITVALDGVRRWRPLWEQVGEVVVVDVGRLYPDSPALRLAGEADVLMLVSPPEAVALAATLEWAQRSGQHSSNDAAIDPARMRLVTVDVTSSRRNRLDPSMLARESLNIAYAGHVPFDDAALSLLSRGASLAHRSLVRSKLAAALRPLTATLMAPATTGASR
jgi:hypothetical protein